MEAFFCPSARKKLPGKHGQQDLIAEHGDSLPDNQAIEIEARFKLARLSL
jgi:hypothetical protein